MHRSVVARLLTVLALTLSLIGASFSLSTASAATTWKPRGEQYANTVVERDVAIPMSDGTILRGDVMRPAGADGKAIDKRFPVIVTITAYNKTALSSAGGHRRGRSVLSRQARLRAAHRGRARHRQLRRHLAGLRRSREQGRRRDHDLGALVGAPVEQRHHRHDRPVVHGHQPALGGRGQAAGAQGDLPAGARRRRLPRRRRLGWAARRRLHPAVARTRHHDGPDPAGRPGQRARSRRSRSCSTT